jgi:Mn2+/Fe2+ NRAMP family transporter
MFLYVRKSFMIFKIVLACIAFLASIIALLGTSQISMLLTQESGKQLAIIMALVFAIITIVEAFMAPPEAIVFGGGGKAVPESPLMEANPVDASITEPDARRRAA